MAGKTESLCNPSDPSPEETRKIAFAVGGLAGNNAFGIGFLEAARVLDVEVSMISCTSGQIFWVAKYLECQQNKTSLRDVLTQEIAKVEATGNPNVDMATAAVWGRPDVFRPAYVEYARDLFANAQKAWQHIAENGANTFLLLEALQTLPGRVLVPLFPRERLESISSILRGSAIGIAFNSYNPPSGSEYVHLNPRARELLGAKSKRPNAYDQGQPSRHRPRTTYQDITPESVLNGLWLYQYGFDQKRDDFLDGAYFRQIMLAELVYATDVFVARPINHEWIGPMPSSQIGIEDLKTEVGFNGAYAGERDQICLINALVERGDLSLDRYHPIRLHEIEIKEQRGFMDYVFEKMEVFERAYEQSMKELEPFAGSGART